MALNLLPLMADLDAVRAAFGCKDEALLGKVLDGSDLPDDDTDPDEYELEGDDDDDTDVPEELPSTQDALCHIIMGEPWVRGIASKYDWAFQALCEHFGVELDHTNWGRTRGEYVQVFDRILAKLGVEADVIRLTSLMGGGGDFPFPPAIAPTFGSMTAAKVARAAAALAAVDRTALEAASQGVKLSRGDVEPKSIVAWFDEVRGWCQTSADAGKGLIVFCG
jgi:hypothetical protein